MRYVPGNAQDIGSRPDQQDSFGFSRLDESSAASHSGFVAVIADGMGGLAHGKEASQTAIQVFLSRYGEKDPSEPIQAALERALMDANHAVVDLGVRVGAAGNVGSTFIAAVLAGTSLHWISVGDSSLYMLRNGHLTPLTSPHIYANELNRRVSEGILAAEEAASHPDREALTSYLGIESLTEIDRTLKPFPLQPGDQMVLATDGVFKTLNEEQMDRATYADPQRTCEQLVRRALDVHAEHQDNLTVVAVGIPSESGVPTTTRRGSGRYAGASGNRASSARRTRFAVAAVCIVLVCGAIAFGLLTHFHRQAKAKPVVRQHVSSAHAISEAKPNPGHPAAHAVAKNADRSTPHEHAISKTHPKKKATPKEGIQF